MGVVSTPVRPCVVELERRVGAMERLIAVAKMVGVKERKVGSCIGSINRDNKFGSSHKVVVNNRTINTP